MEYVDPAIGLECSHCDHVTRLKYSVLRNIIKRRMREAHEAHNGCQADTG